MIVGVPVVLAIALLLWASHRGPPRIDGDWELVSINGDSSVLAPDGSPLGLVGSGDFVIVESGCNTINLPIAENGDRLFGQGVSTAIGCDGLVGEFEESYVRLLADVEIADQDDETLVLVGAGVRIVYTASD